MPTVQCTTEIRASAEALFALGQDYEKRLSWDPFVREIRYLDGATGTGVGVAVRVKARNGLSMVVRYTTVRSPYRVAIAMVSGPALFRKFSGAWTFEPLSGTRTRVTFRYHFDLRTKLARLVLGWFVRKVLRWEMSKRLAAFSKWAQLEGQRLRSTVPISGHTAIM